MSKRKLTAPGDPVVGILDIERKHISTLARQRGVICPNCSPANDDQKAVRVKVFASDLEPQRVNGFQLVTICVRCKRLWNPWRRAWELPEKEQDDLDQDSFLERVSRTRF